MKPRIRLSWWGSLLLFLTLCSATAPAEAVGMPAADRRGAERLFLLAYQDYLQDRPWSCMALSAQALWQVIECANQLRGRCGERQVQGAKVAMAQTYGLMGNSGTTILSI